MTLVLNKIKAIQKNIGLQFLVLLFFMSISGYSYSQWDTEDDGFSEEDSSEFNDDSESFDEGDGFSSFGGDEEEKKVKKDPPKPFVRYKVPYDSMRKMIFYDTMVEDWDCEFCSEDSLFNRADNYFDQTYGKRDYKRFTINKKENSIIELHIKKPFIVTLSENTTNVPGDIEFDLVVRIKEARYKVQAGAFILVAAPSGLGKDYVSTYMEHFITTKKGERMADLYLRSLDSDVQDLINGLIKSMKEPYQPDEDDW